jgi:hypothetical protein
MQASPRSLPWLVHCSSSCTLDSEPYQERTRKGELSSAPMDWLSLGQTVHPDRNSNEHLPSASSGLRVRQASLAPTEFSLYTEAYNTAFEGTPRPDSATPPPSLFWRRHLSDQDYQRFSKIKEEEYAIDLDDGRLQQQTSPTLSRL